ncbi:MAG: glycosyltransferase family 2 protein [Phycisphaera sp.]|nr:MAG: glycosyltransferase family 2 protein [Phycisphaera sp.]
MGSIGAVAIGRNEGERLEACLKALVDDVDHMVYVDSGSTDGSRELARSLGVEVVELDLSQPFTAARARNEGYARLKELLPELEYVQFVDGDCEVRQGWIEKARASLDNDETIAVVCGRRRERFPNASIYNRLTDIEWDTPIGNAKSCGGDALFRARALESVGGYDPSVIAGEEPELCFRLRKEGWRVRRLDLEMTYHDAAMDSFGQWWKRIVRAGHAAAEGAWMHGRSPERYYVIPTLRPIFWAAALPLVALLTAYWTYGLSILLLLLIYAVQWFRMFARQRIRGKTRSDARLQATFIMLAKPAMLIGIMTFVFNRLRGKRTRIIEYKGPTPAGSDA